MTNESVSRLLRGLSNLLSNSAADRLLSDEVQGEGCFGLDYLRQEDPDDPRRRLVWAVKAGDAAAIEVSSLSAGTVVTKSGSA